MMTIRWLILLALWASVVQGDENLVEPPFPQIFNPLAANQHQVHITSEVVCDDNGYQTIEEFFDLELAKQAMILTKSTGHSVVLIDSKSDVIYNYKPYSCTATRSSDAKLDGLDGWKTLIQMDSAKDQVHNIHLFGVTALWTYAAGQPKTYSYGNITYSASKDQYKRTNSWTVNDSGAKISITLNFIDVGQNKNNPDSIITSIQITSQESKRVIRTINVLSVEYMLAEDVYDYILQVPVGYGCVAPESPKPDDASGGETSDHDSWISDGPRKLDLEFTATKYGVTSDQNPQIVSKTRNSDTLSVELAFGQAGKEDNVIQMLRIRNSQQDIKTIINFKYNTKYTIDMRRGTCELSHDQQGTGICNQANPIALKFANGLAINLDFNMMFELFINEDGYKLVKQVRKSNSIVQHHYEERTTNSMFGGRTARIMRAYVDKDLFSITIWILDESQRQIMESYHVNIIETRFLDKYYDLPKVFDISEECYFNNEQMKEGKDYAWMEFQYDVASKHIDVISNSFQELKAIFYRRWITDYFRTPRLELMLNDDGFIVRLLMLDIPPIETIFESTSGKFDSKEANFVSLVQDVSHCADMCRLHSCKTMSFCSNSNQCMLSAKSGSQIRVSPDQSCKLYSLPEDRKDLDDMFAKTLHQTIGLFQAADYEAISVPKMPDELVYPRSETGIDENTYQKMSNEYQNSLNEFMAAFHRGLVMTFTITINEHLVVFMPTKFTLESDPMAELNLKDDIDFALTGMGDGELPPFHEGLTGSRYKINSFSDEQRKGSRLFSGLTYDQCALACVDGTCSSFSFCNHRQECIITNLNSTAYAMESGLIEQNIDCIIAQRDFIANFNKFPNVYRPVRYTKTASSHSASECAFNCITGSDFKCVAFSYCAPVSDKDETGSCFYQKERYYSPADNRSKQGKGGAEVSNSTGCDHYTRSYLADFNRIEGRQIDPEALNRMRTTAYDGKTLFSCADICVNELADCSAFQFCFDPDSKETMQSCTMILGKANDQDQTGLEVEENQDGTVVKAGKLVKASATCHIFSLRKDTSEAHLRDLALGVTLTGDSTGSRTREYRSGLTIWGGIILYLAISFVFAAIGCGFCIAYDRNSYVRERVDRLRIIVGV